VEITDQQENDLISELLVQSKLSPGLLAEVWTGGMGSRTRRSSRFYWDGTGNSINGTRMICFVTNYVYNKTNF
jgi:hypothetical protein